MNEVMNEIRRRRCFYRLKVSTAGHLRWKVLAVDTVSGTTINGYSIYVKLFGSGGDSHVPSRTAFSAALRFLLRDPETSPHVGP